MLQIVEYERLSPVFYTRNKTDSDKYYPTNNIETATINNQEQENLSNSLSRNTNEEKVDTTTDVDKDFKPARQNMIPVMNFIEYLDKTQDRGTRKEKTKKMITQKRRIKGQAVVRKAGGRIGRVLGKVVETAGRAVESVLGRTVVGQEDIVKRRRGRERRRISVSDSIITLAISSGIMAAILGI